MIGKQPDNHGTRHCAGALVFAEKRGTSSQMMRIAERLRMYDPRALAGHADTGEMLATAIGRPIRTAPGRRP